MTDVPQDFAQYLAETMPELVEEFEKSYVHPKYAMPKNGMYSCQRCGAAVRPMMKHVHSQWHRDLSLGIFAIGSAVRFMLNDD